MSLGAQSFPAGWKITVGNLSRQGQSLDEKGRVAKGGVKRGRSDLSFLSLTCSSIPSYNTASYAPQSQRRLPPQSLLISWLVLLISCTLLSCSSSEADCMHPTPLARLAQGPSSPPRSTSRPSLRHQGTLRSSLLPETKPGTAQTTKKERTISSH